MTAEYRIRASSIGNLFDCPMRFEWEQLMGRSKPSGPRALLGSAFHLGTAVFDAARMNGAPVTIGDAVDAARDLIAHPLDEVDWRIEKDLPRRHVESIATTLTTKYCAEWSPKFTFEAVEFPLQNPVVLDVGGVRIALTGTLDRVRVVNDESHDISKKPRRKLQDLKSGRRIITNGAVKVAGFHGQLGIYEVLYEQATGLELTEEPGIIGASTAGDYTIATADAPGARSMLLGTDETPGLLEYAADYLKTGRFPPNPRSPLCSPRYCARWDNCIFHG